MGGRGKSITGIRGIMGYIENSRPVWAIEDPILKILSKVVHVWNLRTQKAEDELPWIQGQLVLCSEFSPSRVRPWLKNQNKANKKPRHIYEHTPSWLLLDTDLMVRRNQTHRRQRSMLFQLHGVLQLSCLLLQLQLCFRSLWFCCESWLTSCLVSGIFAWPPSRTLTLKVKVVGWGS